MQDKNTRLEEIRELLGLNKTQFAEAMGVSKHNYYKMLNPDSGNNVRIEHLEALFNSTGANPMYIITGSGRRFAKDTQVNETQWIVESILPGLPADFEADPSMIQWMSAKIIQHIGVPILSSDFAHDLLINMCRWYLHRNPSAKKDDLNIPALSASLATLMHTANWILDQVLKERDSVEINLNGRQYKFERGGG